jgi:hypothetical protein
MARPHGCTLPRAELSRFSALLQRGAALRVAADSSVERFLLVELGLSPDYVRDRITTVFLDGQVVDRLDEAELRNGSLLALSAAMPGLVGATLRRAGYYAAMRSAITLQAPHPGPLPAGGEREDGASAIPSPFQGEGRAHELVRVKLFNLLIAELGPVLLAHGVIVDRAEAAELLAGSPAASLPPDPVLELRVDLA